MQHYAQYFAAKLDRWLLNTNIAPLDCLAAFVESAKERLQRYQFQRGCLVGNWGHEVNLLPEDYRQQLKAILSDWQQRLARCFEEAKIQGVLAQEANCQQLAEFFWIGWEGAVMHARLSRSVMPLEHFSNFSSQACLVSG